MSFFAGASGGGGSSGHNHGRGVPSRSHSDNYIRPSYARSSSSFFSRGGNGSTSFFSRRPREGYVQYLVRRIKRLLKDLWQYAQRHPLKAFVAIVLPLVSAGGALHGLLRQFGVRLPALDGTTRSYSGGYYGSRGYSEHGGADTMGALGSVFQIAKAFM